MENQFLIEQVHSLLDFQSKRNHIKIIISNKFVRPAKISNGNLKNYILNPNVNVEEKNILIMERDFRDILLKFKQSYKITI